MKQETASRTSKWLILLFSWPSLVLTFGSRRRTGPPPLLSLPIAGGDRTQIRRNGDTGLLEEFVEITKRLRRQQRAHVSFLTLPLELRDMIYDHVWKTRIVEARLGEDFFEAVYKNEKGRYCRDPRAFCTSDTKIRYKTIDLDLLATCRQIYLEARQIPYKNTIFIFDETATLSSFLALPGFSYRNSGLKSLTLRFGPWHTANPNYLAPLVMTLVEYLSSLETINLFYSPQPLSMVQNPAWSFMHPIFTATSQWRDVRAFCDNVRKLRHLRLRKASITLDYSAPGFSHPQLNTLNSIAFKLSVIVQRAIAPEKKVSYAAQQTNGNE